MKALASALLTAGFALTFSNPAHALVRLVQECHTPDGAYTVYVEDNQGIGPVRASHYSADIGDANGNVVGTYTVKPDDRPRSISFGRPAYIDQATLGQKFNLAGPSTNFHNNILHAVLQDGTVLENQNMQCASFGQWR